MSEDGRPFFAMEFIRGMPLDEYARSASTRAARLELLARVCDAVQHAHDKGVVHRDLKPGNILVEESGQPKVLDFGVAHVTAADLLIDLEPDPDRTLAGHLELHEPGTAHRPPERARRSLGCVHAGRHPLRAAGRPAAVPSRSAPNARSGAGDRAEEPSRLGSIDRVYRGDVEIIVAKALEKDKTHRYASAGALASDIRRTCVGKRSWCGRSAPPNDTGGWPGADPWIAALGGVLTAVLIATTAGSMVAATYFRSLAGREFLANQKSQEAQKEAETAKALAQRQAEANRRSLYFAQMNLAGQATALPGGLARVTELIDRWRIDASSPDLRNWEWYYLDALNCQDRFTLRGHSNLIRAVAWSPDGTRLASGSQDQTIRIWDASSGQEIAVWRPRAAGVEAVDWSPDSTRWSRGIAMDRSASGTWTLAAKNGF